jgi:hypothetical protein
MRRSKAEKNRQGSGCMTHFPVDPDSGIQQESFAVIQNP